jgi:hypothetical protein
MFYDKIKLGLWLCDKTSQLGGLESRSGTRRSPLPVHRDGAVPDLELACGGAVSSPRSSTFLSLLRRPLSTTPSSPSPISASALHGPAPNPR